MYGFGNLKDMAATAVVKAADAAEAVGSAAASARELGGAALSKGECGRCGETFNGIRLKACGCCGAPVCSSCSTATTVPAACAHDGVGSPTSAVRCCARECAPRCGEANAAAFKAALTASIAANVAAFHAGTLGVLYPRPGAAVASTSATATARRLAPLALSALKVAGYGEVVYAYFSGVF